MVLPDRDDKIVICTPEVSIARLLEVQIRRRGYRVTVVRNGQAAIDACRKIKPGLLVLDATTQDPGAAEVERTLRSDPATAGTAIQIVRGKGLASWLLKPSLSLFRILKDPRIEIA
jgi:DNA-binding response OmpR family regulator